jgi:hypothetical protein
MSKEQTYITIFEDELGRTIDFERWSDKRVSTVMRKLHRLFNSVSPHSNFERGAVAVKTYSTRPDGTHPLLVNSFTAEGFKLFLSAESTAYSFYFSGN